MNPEHAKQVVEALLPLYEPLRRPDPVAWAEKHITLSRKEGDRPGPYRTSLTPYIREPMRFFSGTEKQMVLCFGSQTSKTLLLMIGQAYLLSNEPSNSLWVFSTEDNARILSGKRLQPLLEGCAPLNRQRLAGAYQWNLLDMNFAQCYLRLVGSHSVSDVASMPMVNLFCDETDKFSGATEKEADIFELAVKRVKTAVRPKVAVSSTPTTEDGKIWRLYMQGDQRRFHVPCPHCGELTILAWSQKTLLPATGKESFMVFTKKYDSEGFLDIPATADTAHFECCHCSGRIENKHKTKINSQGVWVPTNPRGQHLSYHLPSWYAPWGETSYSNLVNQFLSEKQEGSIQSFVTNECAEPYSSSYDVRLDKIKDKLAAAVKVGEGTRLVTVDKQKDHYWAICREYGVDDEGIRCSHLVAWARLATYDDIEKWAGDLGVENFMVGIDSGWGSDVRAEAVSRGWFLIRGVATENFPREHTRDGKVEKPFFVGQIDPYIGTGKQGGKTIPELRFHTDSMKDLVELLANNQMNVKWTVDVDMCTEEYLKHLTSEVKTKVRVGKRTVWRWEKRSQRAQNHLLDCETMQLACASFQGFLGNMTVISDLRLTKPDEDNNED